MENYLDDYPGQIYTHQQDNYHGSTIIQIIILEKFQTDPQDNYPGSTNTYIGPLDFLIFQWDLYFENSPFDPQLFFHLHIQPVQPEKGILKPSHACILFALDRFQSLFSIFFSPFLRCSSTHPLQRSIPSCQSTMVLHVSRTALFISYLWKMQ